MIIKNPKFDDIRPYYEDEIHSAMQRIADNESFSSLVSYIYPQKDIEEVRKMIRGFNTIADFQFTVMKELNEQVIKRSIAKFSYSGTEQIKKDKTYLYVSNHRDIILDSCLLQYILYKEGYDTTEITFGSNLMSNPLVIDIGKANKMFKVERGANIKDFYKISVHLSEYIRYVLKQKGQSVWIAQRNGRTKDGNDVTERGLIKMFTLSKQDNEIDSLAELNIIPIAVSYQWEPCDILKTLELYSSRKTKYIKKPGEDLHSIITGIKQFKGDVHISFCPQITKQELLLYSNLTNNEYHKAVAELIDKRIHENYHLSSNNYIAHDIRYGQTAYEDKYTKQEKDLFLNHMAELQAYDNYDIDILNDIFLGIYSNPIK
jgi:1-acyl-sn-glycerol-3-phosphate acyltransferase